MRTVDSHLLEGKMEEAVTHYITSHQSSEGVHVDANGLTLNVQDDGEGRVVTVMHPHNFTSNMCRQVTVSEPAGEGPWTEELLDTDGRIAALVAHLAQHSRQSHPQPHHMKVTSVRGDVDASVILDAPLRLFNGQSLEPPPDPALGDVPQLPPLPPLQEMKRCQETDWFSNKAKTILKEDSSILPPPEEPPLELGAPHKQQNRKSLPHKKRISRKLRRNNGGGTPHQDIVVINCNEEVPQEEILPDSFAAPHAPQLPGDEHIVHEVRPIFICQLCGEFYGDEQLKFYHHLKQHYEPHGTIIIENPVSDLNIDKMTNTCIVDNVSALPDSIVELSLENTVPKTMYQNIDKHILYTSSDKTLSYSSNKIHYSMASMDKETGVPTNDADKTDLYETLDRLELYSCVKCNKSFRKQKQCEAHIKEMHSNGKLEDMGEFSEPEDLMEGIHVAVEDGEHYEPALLPHLTVDSGHVHQEHVRHWFMRAGAGGACGGDAYCPVCPAPRAPSPPPPHHLKEEVLRIFETDVSNGDTTYSNENIIPESAQEAPPASPPPETKPATDKKKQLKKYDCQDCGRVFHHRNSLMYHTLSHIGKQQNCRECGKSFYTPAALKVHKRVHNDDRPCKCEECGREFRQWSDLKYHKSSKHSNQKNFKCDFCGKEFARKYSLNLHRKIHTGERNYKCEFCNKSFRASSYRISHMRTHTGVKPYKCEECEKCFRMAGDLRRHMLTHEKLRTRLAEMKARKDKKEREDAKPKAEEKIKKFPLASTTKPPIKAAEKKPQKPKKVSAKKGGAPNVTVSHDAPFKVDYSPDEFHARPVENFTKFKEVYDQPNTEFVKDSYKVKEYDIIYKDSERPGERDLIFRNNLCADEKQVFVRAENTGGKMQVFTNVEKTKEYNGPIISSTVSLGEIKHLERDVTREVRDGGGEIMENAFLERLTALYNIVLPEAR